jgi:hypothetical protein
LLSKRDVLRLREITQRLLDPNISLFDPVSAFFVRFERARPIRIRKERVRKYIGLDPRQLRTNRYGSCHSSVSHIGYLSAPAISLALRLSTDRTAGVRALGVLISIGAGPSPPRLLHGTLRRMHSCAYSGGQSRE